MTLSLLQWGRLDEEAEGGLVEQTNAAIESLLQWGRLDEEAEGELHRHYDEWAKRTLQWGRLDEEAEGSLLRSTSQNRQHCFNGAASMKRRKAPL